MKKKTFIFTTLLAVALATGLLFVSCDTGTKSSGGDATPKTEYKGFDDEGNAYTLTITPAAGRAAYSPKDGDEYTLVITLKAGGTKTSSGTVTIADSGFILSNNGSEITVTVESSGSNAGITGFSGDIIIDNSDEKITVVTIIPGTRAKTDSALNGTWVADDGSKFIFNDGVFEYRFLREGDPTRLKGPFTTSKNIFTVTYTLVSNNDGANWLSRAELKSIVQDEKELDNIFATWSAGYSISGNKIVFTWLDDNTKSPPWTKQ